MTICEESRVNLHLPQISTQDTLLHQIADSLPRPIRARRRIDVVFLEDEQRRRPIRRYVEHGRRSGLVSNTTHVSGRHLAWT